jgi:hypothetical protein
VHRVRPGGRSASLAKGPHPVPDLGAVRILLVYEVGHEAPCLRGEGGHGRRGSGKGGTATRERCQGLTFLGIEARATTGVRWVLCLAALFFWTFPLFLTFTSRGIAAHLSCGEKGHDRCHHDDPRRCWHTKKLCARSH